MRLHDAPLAHVPHRHVCHPHPRTLCAPAVFGPLHCTRSLIYQPILVTAKDVVHYIPLTRDIAALFGKLMPTWLSARAMSLR